MEVFNICLLNSAVSFTHILWLQAIFERKSCSLAKVIVHLRKIVHILVGGRYKLHIMHQAITIQLFRKTVYHPFYRIPVQP